MKNLINPEIETVSPSVFLLLLKTPALKKLHLDIENYQLNLNITMGEEDDEETTSVSIKFDNVDDLKYFEVKCIEALNY